LGRGEERIFYRRGSDRFGEAGLKQLRWGESEGRNAGGETGFLGGERGFGREGRGFGSVSIEKSL